MGSKLGIPPAYQKPSGKLYLGSTQQNLVNDVETLVLLDTIPAYHTDGIENAVTHRITPGLAGFYAIVGKVRFVQVVINKPYYARIKISGALVAEHVISPSVTGYSFPAVVVLPCQKLSNTDYVELYAMSISGDNTVDISGAIDTSLEVQRVR